MPHEKLIRLLNYLWLLLVFPVAVAIMVGLFGHSAHLGVKAFLLIECGMAVLMGSVAKFGFRRDLAAERLPCSRQLSVVGLSRRRKRRSISGA
jgi:hypothetical protein